MRIVNLKKLLFALFIFYPQLNQFANPYDFVFREWERDSSRILRSLESNHLPPPMRSL